MRFLRTAPTVRREEIPKVLTLFCYYFAVVAVTIGGKSASDAYFLSRYSKSLLPLMFVAVAVAVAIFVNLYGRISQRLTPGQLLTLTNLVFAASLPAIRLRMEGWAIPFLYVWMNIIIVIMGLQFWLLAADLFDLRQAKRLFGLIAAGGSVAAIVVGSALKPFVSAFGSESLLLVVAGFIVAAWVVSQVAARFERAPAILSRPRRGTVRQPRTFDAYLVSIAVVIAASTIVTMVVDYQFKMIASESFASEEDLVGFFGQFYALTGASTLVVQFLLTGFVLSQIGILAGLLILPLASIAGATAVLVAPVLASAVLAKFSDQSLKFTIHHSSLELLWLPVPPERRQTFKPLISGTMKSVAEGASGVVCFFLVKVLALQYLSILTLAACAVWIFTAMRLKGYYVRALEVAIEKHGLDTEELALDAHDSVIVASIDKALRSDDEIQRLFALELIDRMPHGPWAHTLGELFASGSQEVRRRILTLASDDPVVLSDEVVAKAIGEQSEIAGAAMAVAGKRRLHSVLPQLQMHLGAADPRLRAAAAAAILRLRQGPVEEARAILNGMLDGPSGEQALALEQLDQEFAMLSGPRLIGFLESGTPEVREAALAIAASRRDEALLPAIISSLAIPGTALLARSVLNQFPQAKVIAQIEQRLKEPGLSEGLKLGMLRTLKSYPGDATARLLSRSLEQRERSAYQETVDALLAVSRRHPIPSQVAGEAAEEADKLTRKAYVMNQKLHLLPPEDDARLLRDHFTNEFNLSLLPLLKLQVLSTPDAPIETCIQTIRSKDPARLPFVLELFETILPMEDRRRISPLVEPLSVEQRSQIGGQLFDDLPREQYAVLEEAAYSANDWESVIALDFLFRTRDKAGPKTIDWQKVPVSPLTCELVSRVARGDAGLSGVVPVSRFAHEREVRTMYSTLEKTILLKSVSLFAEIPAETLSRVAQITEEVSFPAHATIFSDGDYGDCLYIVAAGVVRIQKGGKELAVLRKGQCLGEMAVLDQAPRSADAAVLEDTTLLKVTQEDFFEVMSGHPQIMNAIIRLLTGRLREANEKLAEKE